MFGKKPVRPRDHGSIRGDMLKLVDELDARNKVLVSQSQTIDAQIANLQSRQTDINAEAALCKMDADNIQSIYLSE